MDFVEATTQIVKTAIENRVITFNDYSYSNDEAAEKQNAFNYKQITDLIAEVSVAVKNIHKNS